MPPPANSTRDPGLQPERTALSWTRTASGLLLNAILHLRAGYVNDSHPLIALSCALLLAAMAGFWFGRLRHEQLASGDTEALAAPILAIRGLSLATLLGVCTAMMAICSRR